MLGVDCSGDVLVCVRRSFAAGEARLRKLELPASSIGRYGSLAESDDEDEVEEFASSEKDDTAPSFEADRVCLGDAAGGELDESMSIGCGESESAVDADFRLLLPLLIRLLEALLAEAFAFELAFAGVAAATGADSGAAGEFVGSGLVGQIT